MMSEDPFMDDAEWKWHQWMEDHPEFAENWHEFCVMVADALPSAEEVNHALIEMARMMRGDDESG